MLLDDLEIRQVRGLTDEQVNLAKAVAFIFGKIEKNLNSEKHYPLSKSPKSF